MADTDPERRGEHLADREHGGGLAASRSRARRARKSTTKPMSATCGDDVETAGAADDPERAVAERGLDGAASSSSLGPASAGRARRRGAREDERGEEEETRRGLPSNGIGATAAITPPTGTAVCRTPSASPRSPLGNQPMTARPLPDCTLAAEDAAEQEQRDERDEVGANAAPTRHAAHPLRPTASVDALAEAVRGEAPGKHRERRPIHSAATTTPICVEREVVLVTDRGASTGPRSRTVEKAACAAEPAASTAQR